MKTQKVSFREVNAEGYLCCLCGQPLKANLVNRKSVPGTCTCFSCHQVQANTTENRIRTARQTRKHPELRSQARWDKGIPLGGAS